MITAIVGVVLVAIVGLLLFASTKPDSFSMQRSISINAAAENVFALINDFRRWPEWSPWEKLDPSMTRTLGGPPAGRGANYAWQSDGKAGAGRMEITDSVPSEKVGIQLDFIKPFKAHNLVEFTLTPQGEGTQVTWVMRGPTPFVSKLMRVFIDLDTMIGKDFDAGLANLKALAEA